jgi:tripartite-type tricarboxylate transporter receptor subunit TctC
MKILCAGYYKSQRWWVCALSAFALSIMSTAGLAQTLPSGPVHIVVPYPPAAGTDIMARALGQRLQISLGRPVVVENRAGANGVIGIQSVVNSTPDGLTLLFTPSSPIVASPHMYPVTYNILKDLAPVALVATGNFVLVANPSVPFKTLDGFIAYAKEHPDKLSFASAGIGSQAHLDLEMLSSAAGIKVLHVPYKGGGPAATDLLGGHVQLFFESLPVMLPHIKAGTLIALGVTSPEPSPFLPGVPAISATYKNFDVELANPWYAAFAPAGTPEPTLNMLNKEFHEAIRNPELQANLPVGGFVVAPARSPAEFAAFLRTNFDNFGTLIKSLDIKVQ